MVLANADPVIENFQFLLLELQQQLQRASLFLVSNDTKAALTLIDHNDYLINMTSVVKNHCIKALINNPNDHAVMTLRNIYDITSTCSSIGITSADLLRHVSEDVLVQIHDDAATEELFSTIIKAIKKLSGLFTEQRDDLGYELSSIAEQLQDDIYEYNEHLASSEFEYVSQFSHVISMFTNIAHQLMHISESVLSMEQNKVVTIRQFQAMKAALKKVGGKTLAEEASFDRVGETKSGCSIVAVAADKTSSDYMAIFKEGQKDKIKEEKKQFETWNRLFPGVAPRVLSYKKKGRSAGILVEYLKGKTFEQILLSKNRVALDMALDSLCNTIEELWQSTRKDDVKASASYVEQTQKRLSSVLRVHPEYKQPESALGNLTIPDLNTLLKKCEIIEQAVITPFSVFTHGDFNIDNVIFDEDSGQPRFIDLHRSKNTDYLQDVSVFMISNYRIKVVDPEIRKLINRVMLRFYQRVKKFAEKNNDKSFELRLAFGLARSYITSTRFSLDESHADNMFMRGRYLLEKIAETPESQLTAFRLPNGIFYG